MRVNLYAHRCIAGSSYSCLLLYLEEAQQEYSSDNRTPDADPYQKTLLWNDVSGRHAQAGRDDDASGV